MRIEDTISVLHDRVGRHLTPTYGDMVEKKPVRIGVCQRTGATGRIFDYVDSKDDNRVIIPTLVDLLWLFKNHQIVSKGVEKTMRLSGGHLMAITDDAILTNVEFAKSIPSIQIFTSQNDLLAAIVLQRCLFLAFAKQPSAVFGNGLRWSIGDDLEINGRLSIPAIENESINLARAAKIVKSMPQRTALDLRWMLQLPEQSDAIDKERRKLFAKAGLSIEDILPLYRATENEMTMANRLWKV